MDRPRIPHRRPTLTVHLKVLQNFCQTVRNSLRLFSTNLNFLIFRHHYNLSRMMHNWQQGCKIILLHLGTRFTVPTRPRQSQSSTAMGSAFIPLKNLQTFRNGAVWRRRIVIWRSKLRRSQATPLIIWRRYMEFFRIVQ